MKNLKTAPGIIALVAAAIVSSQSLQAATPIWNNPAGGNWSVPGNWSTAAIPGTTDDVQFGDTGAGNLITMDAGFTIDSLIFNQGNGQTQTMVLNPGLTLNINRTTTGDPLTVQGPSLAAGTQVPVTIQGAGAALNVTSSSGNIVVRQGFTGSNGSHMATLDMSALDTFNATVGRLLIGQDNNGDTPGNRPSGTLLLAKTNVITLNGAAPQVMVQDGGQNANGSTASVLSLGQVNVINAANLRLGGQKGNGNVLFNPAFSNPSLTIRNSDGTSRATQIIIGDNSITPSGNSVVAVTDFSAGSVDILVDTNVVAKGNPGGSSTGTSTATLALGAGTMDVNTLIIAQQVATVANGVTTGTMNVNNNGIVTTNINNGLVSTGAVVIVNNSLTLALTNGSTGATAGTLNINGGTVYANNIVAGRGNSTLIMNSGASLVISNSAGTIANPIRTFTINDSSLTLPALNGGAVLAVSNFTAGGSQNTINISSIPPIGSYPATFTLISSVTGTSGNFVKGTLPAASPSYAGTIIDLGNGTVQLQLTAGPLVDLSVLWTGASSADWDTFGTLNWLSHGNPAAFFAGATPIFDDSSVQTNVNLATSISSGTVTVNNSAVNYDFSGPGNIAGASGLLKQGSKTLTIENQGVDNFGSVTISGGTLQIGSGDTNGEISTLNITDNGSLVVNRSGTIGLNAAIAGSGSLTKLGNGTLTLSGANSYAGPTTLSAGGLKVDGSLGGGGALTTAAGTLLSGSGAIAGPVVVAGGLNPGAVNATGLLTLSNNLSLASGSTLTFDLNGADPNNTTVNDAINVMGNLNLTNNTVIANFQGVPFVGNNYPLFTYTGTLSGGFNPNVTGSHFTLALDTNAVAGIVYLSVTGGQGSSLVWSSPSDTTWDSTTTNWTDLNGHTPSLFFSGDSVLLDDTAILPNLVIPTGIAVYPAAITNISDSTSFSITGAGKISGTASIVKGGQSTLTIATANDFSGTVDIQNGVLKVGGPNALGSTAGGTTVEPGGTLDIGGQNLAGEVVTIAGDGYNGQGALINSGGVQGTAFRSLILSSNASVGGSGQFAINNSGGTASLSSQSQPWKLTKVGANQFGLQNLATVDPALGDIEIQQGTLDFNGSTPNMGDPTHTNFVDAGATLQFSSSSIVWNKFFDLTGNGSANTVNNGASSLTELAGPVTLHGGVIINVGGTSLTISGAIDGDGSLTKSGTSPLILSNVETYTGDTTINAGAMRLAGTATILNTTNINIAQGATLTVTGRVDATFTLVSGQNLSGNGTIAGALATQAGSTISPGVLNGIGAIGVLTVSNTITLGGTNTMELNQDSKTNDILFCNNAITYGGVLNLPNLGSPLTNGATFKLFKAGSYAGSFASITPATPGAGLVWNTNSLLTGIIGVTNNGTVVGPTTNATIYSVKAVGTNVVLHGTNNNVPPGSFHYVVLSSTNITLPLSNWTPIVTNAFNSDGSFNYTNPIVQGVPQQFLDVKAVP